MRILITGGAGYIGCSLVDELLKNDAVEEIIVYDNLSHANYQFFITQRQNTSKITFVQGDILDSRKLEQALTGVDVVYHLAAKVSEPERDIDSHYFEQTNHWGTSILANEIEKARPKKVIYASSMYVYGYQDKPIELTTPTTPNSFYGSSKLRGEEQLNRIKDLTDTYIFRIANTYGFNPCIRFDLLVNRLLFDAHYKNKITIYGDGNQVRAFIDVRNVAHTLALAITDELEVGTYNLAQFNYSINEIYDELKQLYPGVQYFYVNRHIEMKSIAVDLSEQVLKTSRWEFLNFQEGLQTIREKII